MRPSRYIVTGATGFLGFHCTERLASEGHEVIAVTRKTSDRSELINLGPRVHIVDAGNDLTDFLNSGDGILHFATDYGKNSNLSDLIKANVIFPLQLLEANSQHARIPFCNMDTYFRKTDQYTYLSDYIYSKRIFLEILRQFAAKGLQIVNFVLEHVFGPRDSTSKFTAQLCSDLVLNKNHIALTRGEQARDFVYVKDAVDAIYTVLSNIPRIAEKTFTEYELGTGESHTIRDFALKAKDISRSNSHLDFGSIPYRPNELMNSVADTTALNRLGWAPKFSFEQGIEAYFDFLKLKKKPERR